jgi:glyoxylase-like metal-dependent hydrolase (beta-lactamase superfamily II)
MFSRQLFDADSSTYTYLLADRRTGEAILIDPVLEQVERDTGLIQELGFTLIAALDTHVHADHITALGTLRSRSGCTTVVSERAGAICQGRLVKQGDRVRFGQHELEVRETPGHTNGCVSYVCH